ncbi:MAG: CRTAC1 family protein [Acidobacteria bacterium]|nr:MAG: CRTAC1 family protein [Acidobacteriota bacterium]
MALGAQEPPTASRAASAWFEEVSSRWSAAFTHRHGGRGDFFMIETMGSGVVAFDYDGDGDDDLLWLDSGDPDHYRGAADGDAPPWLPGRNVLLRNDLGAAPPMQEDGGAVEAIASPRFVDVSEAAGVRLDDYVMGGTAGDVDADGDIDLVVTSFGPTRLLRNDGRGGFEVEPLDESEIFGRPGQRFWGASAALADADRDGDLDLYVTGYVDFDYGRNHLCGEPERGLRSYCHPNSYRGLPDRFYLNDGSGSFREAAAELGLGEANGNGLGVVWLDVGRDLEPDIYVANDLTANYLFRNLGAAHTPRFEERGALYGVALSERGDAEAGMGIGVGDWDGNGLEDLFVTHLDRQTNALYAALSPELFVDQRYQARLAEPSLPRVGFGAAFEDFDLDGDLDLLIANGHIIHNAEEFERGSTYRQPNDLFEQVAGGYRAVAASGLGIVRSSRGLALADFDLDGRTDAAISNSNEASELYRNVAPVATRAALRVRLRDAGAASLGRSPDGIGGWLDLAPATEGAARQSRYVRTASSYLSQNSLEATFGGVSSGQETVRLEVQWPDGRRQRILAPHRTRWLVHRSAAP